MIIQVNKNFPELSAWTCGNSMCIAVLVMRGKDCRQKLVTRL